MARAADLQSDADYVRSRLTDREWRIDHLYHIVDKQGNDCIFARNNNQMTFWRNMWFLNLILKARQQGFSTLIAIFILDACLFSSNTQAGIIDITIGDAQKKLEKIRYAYLHLPEFLRVMIPLKTDNKETLEFGNGSAVFVGTSHRGGTLQVLHVSELGKIAARFPDRAREIRTGALNTVAAGQMVFIESTAEGNSGEFYTNCQQARQAAIAGKLLTQLDYRFHFFGWWQDSDNRLNPDGVYIGREDEQYFDQLEKDIAPVKLDDWQKAWWAKKKGHQLDDMSREFPGTPDEAFKAAIEGAYLGKILERMREKRQIAVVPHDPAYPINSGWDYGLSDTMTIWLHQRIGFEDRLIAYLSGEDDDLLYYWAEMQRQFPGVWGHHFLPHDFGHRRGGTANDSASPPKTLQQILSEAGMRDTFIVPRISDKTAAITEVRLWLPKVAIDEKRCGKGLDCLQNFRKEWDEINGCYKERPRHDWASHGYDGLETLVRGLNAYGCPGMIGTQRDDVIRRKRIG